MTPRSATGEAADEIRHLAPDVETLAQRLAGVDYLVDEGLATSMFLSLRLPQPLLLEGAAGVGKTEAGQGPAAGPPTPPPRGRGVDRPPAPPGPRAGGQPPPPLCDPPPGA